KKRKQASSVEAPESPGGSLVPACEHGPGTGVADGGSGSAAQRPGPFRRLGLGAKFTLTVLAILAATMAANTLYFLETSTRFHEKQLEERGRTLGHLIAPISPEAILGFDYVLLNDYTREAASQRDVVYGIIVSPTGEPISSHVSDSAPLVKERLAAATGA